MKAVIYARYSSDNQREESIEGQLRECTAFAEKNGITILRHYIDRALSAKTDNRPEFQNMIKDSGKKLFDMIIVWKLDRFSRNRYDSARYKAQLKRNGVKVVSATEVISDGAEGIILESMLEGFAEYYSADLSEKVVRGMTDNALKCMFNGGTLPMGYLIDADQHFQVDPVTAPFILDAFKRYDEGATMTEIRDWLNEQGMKNTRGNPLTYNSVQHLLNNRRYIGEYVYRDIVVPDGIPAIVPIELFESVQRKLAKNKKAPARHKAEDDYLLTTKLFCGYCGAYLCGESGTSRTGVVHHYYKCVSVKKKRTECHKKPVKKLWIEDLVVSATMEMIMDDAAIEAIVSMLMDIQEQENSKIPLYEQQLQETNSSIRNMLNAIQQGILTKSTRERLEELEAAKEELEQRLDYEKLSKPPKVSAEFMTFWLHRFRKLDVTKQSHRKMLIDTFVNAIFLYDDKMLITFNYKDGTKTITFGEAKEAAEKAASGSDLDCSTAPADSVDTQKSGGDSTNPNLITRWRGSGLSSRTAQEKSNATHWTFSEPQNTKEPPMHVTIRRTEFAPGSRVIVTGDIHGHADHLRRLLGKVGYRPGADYLVILGDLVEKGSDSLGVVREAMRLADESPRVTVLMGNNDLWRLEQLTEPTPERDEILLRSTAHFTRHWGSSLFHEMCREIGAAYTSLDDLPAAREAVSRAFADELSFLAGLHTILETPHYVFVHGGLPCPIGEIDTLTARNAYTCLKYDDFRGDLAQRNAPPFPRPIIVGHWPVALYRKQITEQNPLIDDRFNVISTDGGCGLKRDGQLNALILSPDDGGIAWDSVDDLPTIRALDPQDASEDPISISWGDNEVRRLDDASRPGYALSEHVRTGRRLWIPEDDFYTEDDTLYCRETTDYALPVSPGDTLSLVKAMHDAVIVKKDGIVGWYRGRWVR